MSLYFSDRRGGASLRYRHRAEITVLTGWRRGVGGGGHTYHASHRFTLRNILLSLDLRKSGVEEREKRARSWCHNYLFLMSQLLVSTDINHHQNFKGKSHVTLCENSKSRITLLCPITPYAANLGPITYHADNLGPIKHHGKPLCHPVLICEYTHSFTWHLHYLRWFTLYNKIYFWNIKSSCCDICGYQTTNFSITKTLSSQQNMIDDQLCFTREPIEQLMSVELFASCVPPLAQFPPFSRVRSCSFQRREEVYSQVAQKSIPLVSSHHAHIIIAKRRSYYRLKNEIYYVHS